MKEQKYHLYLSKEEYIEVLQSLSVRVNQYSVGHYEVRGYGVPQY